MTSAFWLWLALALSVGVAIYVLYALLRAEDFA
jgi:K+-transporting ATPase KdpF subunit